MASKYAALKGKIPGEMSARDVALLAELDANRQASVAQLTAEYNAVLEATAKLAEEAKRLKVLADARKILILDRITESGGDGFKGLNGFTWTESFEPYPVCQDPTAAIQYFKDNGMEDQLQLKSSEVNARLANFVKEEALRGELKIETIQEIDQATGETREVQVVKSKVPGVLVYLDTKLSRVKVGTKSATNKE